MIADDRTNLWLQHRCGLSRLTAHPFAYVCKSLDANRTAPDFLASHGNSTIQCFTGFIDIAGFSTRVKGREPHEITSYLKPFRRHITTIVPKHNGMIDKTIGDEVMFVLPDMGEDGGVPAIFGITSLLVDILELRKTLGADYPLQIGLAYGRAHVTPIVVPEYHEWTVDGESINLAKRLQSLRHPANSTEPVIHFGALWREVPRVQFSRLLECFAGFASTLTHTVVKNPRSLKGVSKYNGASVTRRPTMGRARHASRD